MKRATKIKTKTGIVTCFSSNDSIKRLSRLIPSLLDCDNDIILVRYTEITNHCLLESYSATVKHSFYMGLCSVMLLEGNKVKGDWAMEYEFYLN
jgi:hypothetical protein